MKAAAYFSKSAFSYFSASSRGLAETGASGSDSRSGSTASSSGSSYGAIPPGPTINSSPSASLGASIMKK